MENEKTYFVSYMKFNGDGTINYGNGVVFSDLRGRDLVRYINEERKKEVPDSVVMCISEV